MHPWFGILRSWAITAAIIPVVLGAVMAAADGSFSWLLLCLTLVSGMLLQTACNLLNTHGDYLSGVDTVEYPPNAPQLVYRQLRPAAVLRVGLALLTLGGLTGLIAAALSSWHLLWFAVAGVAGAGLYTSGIRYKYLGVGVPFVMLLMGVLMVLASYFAHTGTLTWRALVASLPIACLVGVILHGNDLRDTTRDRLAGITTTSLLLGSRNGPRLFVALHVLPYLIVVGALLARMLPVWTLLTLLALPLSVKIISACLRHETEQLEGTSAGIHFVFGLLLITGVALSLLH